MPLIDQQGRLGGRVNVLDLLVVLVLVAALAWWGLARQPRPTAQVQPARISVVLDSEAVHPGAENIQVGDKAFLFNGSTSFYIGTVAGVDVQPYPYRANLPDGRVVVAPDPVHKLVRVTVTGQGSATPSLVSLEGQAMLVGYRFRLRTPRTDFLVAVRDLKVEPAAGAKP